MKIVSNFHDYYDSVMAHGQDHSVVWVRKELEYDTQRDSTPKLITELSNEINKAVGEDVISAVNRYDRIYRHWLRLTPFTIVFCGKTYNGVTVMCSSPLIVKTFYSFDKLNECLVDMTKGVELVSNKYSVGGMLEWGSKRTVKDYFNVVQNINQDWLIANKVTCALQLHSNHHTKCDTVIVNPCLNSYEFYKVMDSFSAYQELDMWLSGTLAFPQNIMIEIEDKYRIEAHGFDTKYGFRKRPTNK